MTILNKVNELYKDLGQDMFRDITLYMEHEYIYKGPTYLILGKAVRRDGGEPEGQWNVKDPDAWFVHTAVGVEHVEDFFNFMPYQLPFVGWKRRIKNKGIQWFDFNKLKRRFKK
jgi:hypothetical protein